MNQLLKTLLDHPDKIERILLWILQSSVIVWGLSVFFDLNLLELTVDEGDLEISFPNDVTAIQLAFYFAGTFHWFASMYLGPH